MPIKLQTTVTQEFMDKCVEQAKREGYTKATGVNMALWLRNLVEDRINGRQVGGSMPPGDGYRWGR